jgi:hypothetical protein
VAQKTKLRVLLPIIQVAITAVLTRWADSAQWMVLGDSNRVPGRFARADLFVVGLRQIWQGVNAPALPFSLGGGGAPGKMLGFSLGEILYFAVVGLLWWFVGRYADRRMGARKTDDSDTHLSVLSVLGIVWGLFLLGVTFLWINDSLHIFRDSSMFRNLLFLLRNYPEVIVRHFLFLFWSMALLVLNGATVTRYLRHRYTTVVSPNSRC